MSEIIYSRETGKYPLSIGTSLAIESLTNVSDLVQHPSPPLEQVDEVWVNLRTLLRNLVNSVPTEHRAKLFPDELESVLYSEMGFIAQAIQEQSSAKVVFYRSDLVMAKYIHARIRHAKTENQKFMDGIMAKVLSKVVKHFKEHPAENFEVKTFLLKVHPDKKCRAYILTHMPIDLLSYRSFSSLILLESHTGKIKERQFWYTKYFNGTKDEDISRLPFNEKLLQVFGDNVSFAPYDMKVRKDILELAKKFNWTPLTTDDRVGYGVNTLKNRYFVDIFRSM